jgi:hypothetical protein
MNNLWVQREDAVAVWIGDITSALDKPDAIVSMLMEIYELGRELELLLLDDVTPSAEIRLLWDNEQKLDVFRLLSKHRVSSRVSWFDRDDALASGMVADLGLLLASLEPAPGSIPKDAREIGESPISFGGTQLQYKHGQLVPEHRFPMQFSISIYSDIWMPYVLGMAHPSFDSKHFFDNRELAVRNSERFNDLLANVGASVRKVGGMWLLDEAATMKAYLPWLSERGIELSREPQLLQPPSALDQEWVARDQ